MAETGVDTHLTDMLETSCYQRRCDVKVDPTFLMLDRRYCEVLNAECFSKEKETFNTDH